MSVVNLKDLVEAYAHKFFKENERDFYKQMGKHCNWRELTKVIDWKNLRYISDECKLIERLNIKFVDIVRIQHQEAKCQDLDKPGAPKSHVLFRSTFINDTNKEQEYQLAAERKTMSTCSFELFEGFVNEGQAELSIKVPIPGCALEAGAGFRHEYVLESSRTKTVQEELNWSVQSTIKIPSMSMTTAELLVQENEYRGRFEIRSYFSGEIGVKLFRDGHEMLLIELADLDEVLTRDKGFQKDSKGLFRVSRGECKARFGINQKVELHQHSLKQS